MDRMLARIDCMKLVRLWAAGGSCAVLALAAAGAAAAGDGGPAAAAGNRASAAADVRALLGLALLPPGAARLPGEPAGAGTIDNEQPNEQTPDLVDAHSWWRVALAPGAVVAYVKAHPPRGSSSSGNGYGSSRPPGSGSSTVTSSYLTFTFPARPGVLDSRTLIVKTTAIAAGVTAVRVDAEDIWDVPRAASERIPAGVHEVDVTRALPGKPPSVSVHVAQASKVAAIVKLLDGLAVVQPGALACPMIPAGAPTVTFTFRSKLGGAVLARASQLALAMEAATPCDPLTLRIGGHQQTPLLAGSGFLTAVGKLLGRRLAASPSP